MSDSQLTHNRNRALVAMVVLLALVAAVLTIALGDSSSEARTEAIAVSPETALPDFDPIPLDGAPSNGPTQPAPTNDSESSPNSPAGATTPTIGPITLTSDLDCDNLPAGSPCEEIVVTDLTVSVVNGNGTVTPFIDIDAAPQVALVPGQPLTLCNGAASGIDPSDINRIEVDFFEHMFAREVQVSAEDNGSFSVTVPARNATDGTWTLSFSVDGLV